jgi:hypothetical protein
MAEEGGAAPALASATDHEYTAHQQQPIHITPNPVINNSSRKSTLKSDFDVNVNGTRTPMTGLGTRHSLDLDDYFVCPLERWHFKPCAPFRE